MAGDAVCNVIFDKNTEWSYYDQGSLDGQAWTSSTYNVSEWASGDSPLGYYTGDNNNSRGYNSILDYGYDSSNKRPTYYFRKTFKLTSIPSESDVMVFDYIVDDGFIIYVNGKEAGRYLMPSSNVVKRRSVNSLFICIQTKLFVVSYIGFNGCYL